MSDRPDVVVVGGGAAGLAAAERLARGGAVVVLVEARRRLGGRIDTRRPSAWPAPLELGAEFVHGRDPALLDLAEEGGASVGPVEGGFLCREASGLVPCGEAFGEVSEWLRSLDGAPDVPLRRVLDEARSFSVPHRKLLEAFVSGYYLADPATVSARFLGHEEGGVSAPAAGFQGRVPQGYDRVLAPLAQALGMGLVDVRVGCALRQVTWSPGRVALDLVGEGNGERIEARAAVLTLPVGVLKADPGAEGAVRFDPRLPEKEAAARSLGMGPVVKVHLRFHRTHWPEEAGFLMDPGAAFSTFWTPRPGVAMITGWSGGERAAAVAGRPPGVQVATAVAGLAGLLGRSPAELLADVAGARAVDWSRDPFARGGYLTVPAGAFEAWRRLPEPVADTLFFAGEATHGNRQSGTVHGALETGRRAADEALAALGRA